MFLKDPAEDRDASFLLESLMSVEVRMSDLVDGGDDSHVRLSDLCTLYVVDGGDRIGAYLTDALNSFSRLSPYRLELTFGGNTKVLRNGDSLPG